MRWAQSTPARVCTTPTASLAHSSVMNTGIANMTALGLPLRTEHGERDISVYFLPPTCRAASCLSPLGVRVASVERGAGPSELSPLGLMSGLKGAPVPQVAGGFLPVVSWKAPCSGTGCVTAHFLPTLPSRGCCYSRPWVLSCHGLTHLHWAE